MAIYTGLLSQPSNRVGYWMNATARTAFITT